MKKIILFWYLNLSVFTFSRTIEEIKSSYEYILGESIWGMIIVFPLITFSFLFLCEVYKELKPYIKKHIFKEKEFENSKIIIYLNLIIFWYFLTTNSWILNKITPIFPIELILFFIYSLKKILTLIFENIDKKKLDNFILYFLVLLILSSFGNISLNNILEIFTKILP